MCSRSVCDEAVNILDTFYTEMRDEDMTDFVIFSASDAIQQPFGSASETEGVLHI